MKKIIIVLFVLSSFFIFNNKDEIVIPKDSIRFRIIANSDTLQDQNIKNTIKNDLLKEVIPSIIKANNIKGSRELVTKAIPQIKNELNK